MWFFIQEQLPTVDTNGKLMLADNGKILTGLPHITSHQRFELQAQIKQCLLQFLFIPRFDIFFRSLCDNLIYDFLWNLKLLFEEFKSRILLLQLLTILVNIMQTCIDDERMS